MIENYIASITSSTDADPSISFLLPKTKTGIVAKPGFSSNPNY